MKLELRDVESGYGSSQVLFGIDLQVDDGEVVTLLGRNGMGKTTTVRTILGIVPATAGRISFEGTRIDGWPAHRIARFGIGLVPEGRQIFPNLTVRENLLAFARAGTDDPWSLDAILDLFPALVERLDSAGNQLSGGEQQMLAIGRALMTNPRLLVLDEATEGLAPLVRSEIWSCLERLKAARLAILLIDKNISDLVRVADRHHIVEKGQVVWYGDSAALRADPDLQERYLGV